MTAQRQALSPANATDQTSELLATLKVRGSDFGRQVEEARDRPVIGS